MKQGDVIYKNGVELLVVLSYDHNEPCKGCFFYEATPVASDYTGSCTIRKMTKSNGAPRTDSLRNMPAVIGMDGDQFNGRVFQLSPLFVEEMMGYPLMWTTLPFLTENGEKNP